MDCATGEVQFFLKPSLFPIDPGTYSYQWTGSNGYTSTDSVAMLVNNDSLDNGTYTLIVTDILNCASDPVDYIVSITNQPPQPIINNDTTICESQPITFSVKNTSDYDGLNVQYNWKTPFGIVATADPQLIIVNPTVNHSFNYSVIVEQDGDCLSDPSNDAVLTVLAKPDQPVMRVEEASICEGVNIELSTDPVLNATYQWLGANGLDTTTMIPQLTIPNADINDTGDYRLVLKVGDCTSDTSLVVSVDVIDGLSKPEAENDGPLCLVPGGNILTLSISDATYNSNYSYIWIDSISGDTVAGPSSNQDAAVVDFSNYPNGVFKFSVIGNFNGCLSDTSTATIVEINTQGEDADAGMDMTLCNVDTLRLSANNPTEGVGTWQQIEGLEAIIEKPDSHLTKVDNILAGMDYAFEWSLSNGVCGVYSRDTVAFIIGDNTDQAIATENINFCDSSSITLAATAAMNGNIGTWTQSNNQQNSGINILEPNNPLTKVTGLQKGANYIFTWVLNNEACGNFSSASTSVVIDNSDNIADAGMDEDVCGDPEAVLMAVDANGQWTSEDADIDIIDPGMAVTEVRNLKVGANSFTWTVDNGTCGISSDEVVLQFEATPMLTDDNTELKFTPQIMIDVLSNDVLPVNFDLILESQPGRGRVILENNMFTYEPDPGFKGIDRFVYKVCSVSCSDNCELAIVNIDVENQFSCTIPTIITPNNDGANDSFTIPCLGEGGDFDNNQVSIYNQWGDEVFRAAPYRNDWQGTFDGQDLPSGTYYYIVDFGKGDKPEAGFLILER